jgi:hypothetical protein
MRRAILLAGAVAAALAASAAATAARPSLTVHPSTVVRGGSVVVRGSADGCPVGDRVTLISHAFARVHRFAGVPAVFARVRAGGRFRTTARIPRTRRVGRYVITARCGGGNLGVSARLRVRA